ncbi:hypothetical protein Landi51_11089 [Colletotrichum acutatum]
MLQEPAPRRNLGNTGRQGYVARYDLISYLLRAVAAKRYLTTIVPFLAYPLNRCPPPPFSIRPSRASQRLQEVDARTGWRGRHRWQPMVSGRVPYLCLRQHLSRSAIDDSFLLQKNPSLFASNTKSLFSNIVIIALAPAPSPPSVELHSPWLFHGKGPAPAITTETSKVITVGQSKTAAGHCRSGKPLRRLACPCCVALSEKPRSQRVTLLRGASLTTARR